MSDLEANREGDMTLAQESAIRKRMGYKNLGYLVLLIFGGVCVTIVALSPDYSPNAQIQAIVIGIILFGLAFIVGLFLPYRERRLLDEELLNNIAIFVVTGQPQLSVDPKYVPGNENSGVSNLSWYILKIRDAEFRIALEAATVFETYKALTCRVYYLRHNNRMLSAEFLSAAEIPPEDAEILNNVRQRLGS
jgi:hypothetical protein